MDPYVESAIINAAAIVVSVGATAAVAIVGFRISRSANQATIDAAKASADTTVTAARDTNKATIEAARADVRRTLDATRDGQIADRYTKAIEQLGSEKLDVRIGGIYALERIARDSPRDHPTVMEVLSAFVREHSREEWPLPAADESKPQLRAANEAKSPSLRADVSEPPPPAADEDQPPRATRPDVQAALTVVGRRDTERDIRRIDLNGANLTHANLTRATFAGANLASADLTRAFWPVDGAAPDGWQRNGEGRLERIGTGTAVAK